MIKFTPQPKHLKGFGAVNKNTKGVKEWLKEIMMLNFIKKLKGGSND